MTDTQSYALLSALKTALRHAREAMWEVDRQAFDRRERGPEWMFEARDAIERAED